MWRREGPGEAPAGGGRRRQSGGHSDLHKRQPAHGRPARDPRRDAAGGARGLAGGASPGDYRAGPGGGDRPRRLPDREGGRGASGGQGTRDGAVRRGNRAAVQRQRSGRGRPGQARGRRRDRSVMIALSAAEIAAIVGGAVTGTGTTGTGQPAPDPAGIFVTGPVV